ncbi:hypothetical protein H6CHR_01640 [Variovorax sp. PBL-H6]|uniref:hypothetical protein n=1 Tax=Variovorax sp. PBL-H6 TaxID=434009 RepID=UPI001315B8F2|nr:hypothetical protein [Variovorax sp. PBL-H6]VTU21690.1 hypothetical protein H6CHR_01640 [Variovorax sp. PBL-H6]
MPAPEVSARPIAWTGAAIALTVLAVVAAVFLLLRHWDLPFDAERARLSYDVSIGGATLQSAPQLDLARYRAEKRKLLETSGWVDASRGIVRIPIDSAIDILADPAPQPMPSETREQR